MRALVLAGLTALGVGAAAGVPQDTAAQAAFEVFTPPMGAPETPRYPRGRRFQDREGWVSVHFMVDPDGQPYEVAVIDSIGDPVFERAAIEAVERSVFEPARLDGRAIDAGRSLHITFQLQGLQPGARPFFVRSYRAISRAVDAGERDAARDLLEGLEPHNLYEEAFANLGRYSYAARWGDRGQQLSALLRATRHEGKTRYLPDEVLSWALQRQFALQLRMQHFAGALKTWNELQQIGMPEEIEAQLRAAVDEIGALRDDERAFTVPGHIGSASSWFHDLLKARFAIDVTDGELADLKLRCDRAYVMFRYDPEREYRIADGSGQCSLEVIGEPGSTFLLVQR